MGWNKLCEGNITNRLPQRGNSNRREKKRIAHNCLYGVKSSIFGDQHKQR